MWHMITVSILVVELALLLFFIIGKFKKRNLNEAALFLAVVFIVNLALHYVPFLYKVLVLKTEHNYLIGLIDSFGASLKLFVGEPNVESIEDFADAVPLFTYVYFLGLAMALLATVSTAIEVFNHTLHNSLRLAKLMKQESCEIVLGNSAKALQYAKVHNAVVVLDESVSKDMAVKLMEEGYAVLRKGFTESFLRYRRFQSTTRYNIICPGSEPVLERIDTFIACRKANPQADNFHFYAEVEEESADTVRREIIEKSGFGAWISTFCTNELLAKVFAERNPITRYIPKDFVEEGAIKPDAKLNIFLLGFGKLSKQLYRQCILMNQLVTPVDGEYKLLPVHYYICDTGVDTDIWCIDGLRDALQELDPAKHFPLPELPYETKVISKDPASRNVLNTIKKQVQRSNSYTMVLVCTDEDCCNIDIGAKLKTELLGNSNYRIFVRSESPFVQNDGPITYFGKTQDVLTHDIIVNDSQSYIAKKVDEVYIAQSIKKQTGKPVDPEEVRKKAAEKWNGYSFFRRQTNIAAARNLRVALNLLGLDLKSDGAGKNISLIKEHYPRKDSYEYSEYLQPSLRSALMAQEHARWNAFHLLNEYLPMEKSAITRIPVKEGEKPGFDTKNDAAKKHCCITTHPGLDQLSSYLAEKAGGEYTAEDYEYYIYDEMLITSASELLEKIACSVTEK